MNLEVIGVSAQHAVLGHERFALSSYPPDPGLLTLLAELHRQTLGTPLLELPWGGATDARSFLAHGIPAATLISRGSDAYFARDLHSAGDNRDRIDAAALDASLEYLLAVARRADQQGL